MNNFSVQHQLCHFTGTPSAHRHIHAYAHAHIHVHVYTYKRRNARLHARPTHMYERTQAGRQERTHAFAHTHPLTCAQTHAHTYADASTRISRCTHTHSERGDEGETFLGPGCCPFPVSQLWAHNCQSLFFSKKPVRNLQQLEQSLTIFSEYI